MKKSRLRIGLEWATKGRAGTPLPAAARTECAPCQPKVRNYYKWLPWILTGIFSAWFLSGAQAPKPANGFKVAAWGRLHWASFKAAGAPAAPPPGAPAAAWT